MNLDTSKWSQADYTTGLALLSAEAGRLEAKLVLKVKADQVPARPPLKGGAANAIQDFALMAAHITKLNDLASLSAETVTNPSASAKPAQATTASAKTAPFNPDAALLAARGVQSYDQLSASQLPPSTTAPGAKGTPGSSETNGQPSHVTGWNPDAKILEARGVSSLEELNKKGATESAQD